MMQIISLWHRVNTLSTRAKVGLVVGGYVAAILLAVCVVSIYIDLTSGPDRDASGGMYAFGDSLLFIAVFGTASIMPTSLALIFLRNSRKFWITCCFVAVAVAATSLVAAGADLMETRHGELTGSFHVWAMFALPRLFLAPFLAVIFALAAWAAPATRFRWFLAAAAGAEALGGIYGFVRWFALMFIR